MTKKLNSYTEDGWPLATPMEGWNMSEEECREYGGIWVKTFDRKNGVHVKGHCTRPRWKSERR